MSKAREMTATAILRRNTRQARKLRKLTDDVLRQMRDACMAIIRTMEAEGIKVIDLPLSDGDRAAVQKILDETAEMRRPLKG